MPIGFGTMQPFMFAFGLAAIWSIAWKGWALWLAARRGEKVWFIALLFINTIGILDIVYIFIIAKQKDVIEDEKKDEITVVETPEAHS